jgi:hypothetical protein
LTIHLAEDASHLRVLRDDVELGSASLGVALPVDPGKHTVVTREGDRVLYSVEFELLERQ